MLLKLAKSDRSNVIVLGYTIFLFLIQLFIRMFWERIVLNNMEGYYSQRRFPSMTNSFVPKLDDLADGFFEAEGSNVADVRASHSCMALLDLW